MSEELARLGFTQSRGVVISASDAGLCYAVNEGIQRARANQYVSGASLLVVAPFARHAVECLGPDLGIQLALSSEHRLLELRPITYSPSLLGGSGGLPNSAGDAAEHADPEEVEREFRAQIERAKVLGVQPSFLATHDDVVARQLSLFDVFLGLAEEYALPIRHGYDFGPIALDAAKLARDRGHFVAATTINWSPSTGTRLDDVMADLPQGISEIIVSPALEGQEIQAILEDANERVATLDSLAAISPSELAKKHNIAWLKWGELSLL